MSGALSPVHWLIIIGVLVLLFGAKKLPDAARGVGQSLRIFKSEVSAARGDNPGDQTPGEQTRGEQTPGDRTRGEQTRGEEPPARSPEQIAAGPSTANPPTVTASTASTAAARPTAEGDHSAAPAPAPVVSPEGSSPGHRPAEG